MKKILACLFSFFCVLYYAQIERFMLIDIQTKEEFSRADSLSVVKFLDSLAENHYYFTQMVHVEKAEDRVKIYFDKGKNFNQARVQLVPPLSQELKRDKAFFVNNLDSLRQEINKKYAEKGFVFNRVKTQYLGMKDGIPLVEISVLQGEQRKINGFKLRGYTKVPYRFLRHLEKHFIGKHYDEQRLNAIYSSLKNHAFVSLERPPQTLFTKDSTQIYLTLQKKKVNLFDGIIGFGNNESEKIAFNGTLNLVFQNMFNGFEYLGLYWQRGADKGQNFDLKLRLPYLFNSNLGTDIQLNIYRQNKDFANVKFYPSLFYNLSERQKIGFRGNVEMSSVLDSLYTSAKDFRRTGVGAWYEYEQPSEVELFINDLKIRVEADLLNTQYDKENTQAKTLRYFVLGEKNMHLSGNHYLNIKAETAMLNTKAAISVNELFRIGGWNSLRGFNENSILANFYAYGGAEYRYLVGKTAFFDVFAQYAQMKNKTLIQHPKLYSVGVGFQFLLPIGQMSFQISNGSQLGEPFRLKETKIHWGMVSRF